MAEGHQSDAWQPTENCAESQDFLTITRITHTLLGMQEARGCRLGMRKHPAIPVLEILRLQRIGVPCGLTQLHHSVITGSPTATEC